MIWCLRFYSAIYFFGVFNLLVKFIFVLQFASRGSRGTGIVVLWYVSSRSGPDGDKEQRRSSKVVCSCLIVSRHGMLQPVLGALFFLGYCSILTSRSGRTDSWCSDFLCCKHSFRSGRIRQVRSEVLRNAALPEIQRRDHERLY